MAWLLQRGMRKLMSYIRADVAEGTPLPMGQYITVYITDIVLYRTNVPKLIRNPDLGLDLDGGIW